MTTKTAIISSLIWTALIVVLGSFAIWYIVNNPVVGSTVEERSARAGSGFGTLAGIGYGCIWIPWAIAVRQRRLAPRKKRLKKTRK